MSAVILSTGIFMGGLAQIMAGAMEWKKGNTFGTTAFTSYGMFWLILVGIILFPKTGYMAARHWGGDGGIPCFMGRFHFVHVRRDPAHQ